MELYSMIAYALSCMVVVLIIYMPKVKDNDKLAARFLSAIIFLVIICIASINGCISQESILSLLSMIGFGS